MEAWKDSLIDCIKTLEEAQQDATLDSEKRNELNELIVRIQEIMED